MGVGAVKSLTTEKMQFSTVMSILTVLLDGEDCILGGRWGVDMPSLQCTSRASNKAPNLLFSSSPLHDAASASPNTLDGRRQIHLLKS